MKPIPMSNSVCLQFSLNLNIKKSLALLLLCLCSQGVFSQSKKDLRSTVLKLQADSTFLDQKLNENILMLASVNAELSEEKVLNQQLNTQIENLKLKVKSKDSLANALAILTDSINRYNVKLDSINTYSRILNFINAFYASLETSEEENLRQYEYRDMKFDLENFNSLISSNARYSLGRVKNLSDERNHDKYFIMLQEIVEIKFSVDKILVKTKVMYSGEKMGLFYNEEQLTLRDKKGLLKLTDWVDLDLYKMVPTIDADIDNFTREDFYKWIDGRSK